jgi:hypothetical protein
MIWAQVKGYVAANNKTFKLGDVRLLLEKGIQNVTPERWEKCVQHVIKEEDKMWNLDAGPDCGFKTSEANFKCRAPKTSFITN